MVAALLGRQPRPRSPPRSSAHREVVLSYVLAHAERGPVLVVIEDLHWADPSTLELAGELLDAIAEARVLLVATLRPVLRCRGGRAATCQPARARPVHAPPRPRRWSAHVAPAPLPAASCRRSSSAASGVPLFIEELARAAAGGGTAIPATLHDSLMARLDRLGPRPRGGRPARRADRPRVRRATCWPRHRSRPPRRARPRARGAHRGASCCGGADARPIVRYAFRHALLREAASQSRAGPARRALHLPDRRCARARSRRSWARAARRGGPPPRGRR